VCVRVCVCVCVNIAINLRECYVITRYTYHYTSPLAFTECVTDEK